MIKLVSNCLSLTVLKIIVAYSGGDYSNFGLLSSAVFSSSEAGDISSSTSSTSASLGCLSSSGISGDVAIIGIVSSAVAESSDLGDKGRGSSGVANSRISVVLADL